MFKKPTLRAKLKGQIKKIPWPVFGALGGVAAAFSFFYTNMRNVYCLDMNIQQAYFEQFNAYLSGSLKNCGNQHININGIGMSVFKPGDEEVISNITIIYPFATAESINTRDLVFPFSLASKEIKSFDGIFMLKYGRALDKYKIEKEPSRTVLTFEIRGVEAGDFSVSANVFERYNNNWNKVLMHHNRVYYRTFWHLP